MVINWVMMGQMGPNKLGSEWKGRAAMKAGRAPKRVETGKDRTGEALTRRRRSSTRSRKRAKCSSEMEAIAVTPPIPLVCCRLAVMD